MTGALALVAIGGVAGCVAPSPKVPDEVRTAVDSVTAMEGITQVDVERHESIVTRPAGNFGERRGPSPTSVAVDVLLDERLAADVAGEVVGAAFSTLARDAAVLDQDRAITLSLSFRAGSDRGQTAAPADRCGVLPAGDAVKIMATGSSSPADVTDATVDAFELHAAGASHVHVDTSTGLDGELAGASVVVPKAGELQRIAGEAVNLDRPITLAAPGVRYGQAYSLPDPHAVELVVSAAQRPGAVCTEYLAQDHQLTVRTDLDPGSGASMELQHWLERQQDGQSAAGSWSYVVLDAQGGRTEG